MKILYFITSFGVGGAENLLMSVLPKLSGDNEITLAFFKERREPPRVSDKNGVKIVFIPFTPARIFGVIGDVRRLVIKTGADVVHTHLPLADSLGRLGALMARRAKIVSTIHNSDLWKLQKTPHSFLLRLYNRITVNRFKRVSLIAVSQSVKDFCVAREKIRDDKITVIYNFAETEAPEKRAEGFTPPFDRSHFVMVCVSRLADNKGHKFLVSALGELVRDEKYAHARLVLVGDGEERANLESQVRELGLEGKVAFEGFRKNVFDYLESSQLFVLASANEGQSLAILEAFHCGTCVLASDNESNMELLQGGKNGVLFKYGDVGSLTEAIKSIMDGRTDVEELKARAATFGEGLSSKAHVKRLMDYYHSIL